MKVLIVSIAYFYYNWYFFKYTESILEKPGIKVRYITASFLINYALFFVCSYLQLHLIINWSIFFFFLLAEVMLIFQGRRLPDITAALSGTMAGLALNIFFRDIMSVLMDVPLASFDNNTSEPGNYKIYPIILGFIAAGLVFQSARRKRNSRMKVIFKYEKNLRFLAGLMIIMYAYLCMNLLVYYAPGNSLILKLWTIKSSVAVLIGYVIASIFTYRLCMLEQYRKQNYETIEALKNEKMEEQELRSLIYLDPLTGCRNRQGAKKTITNALKGKRDFCLCFADLDRLKPVNDGLGHSRGDDYLLAAAKELRSHLREGCDEVFRYGGDEFIIIFYDIELQLVRERMCKVSAGLAALGNSADYPFNMSLSVGIVESRGYSDVDELIGEADRRMYEEKQAHAEKYTGLTSKNT